MDDFSTLADPAKTVAAVGHCSNSRDASGFGV
jgi:hypothetical protein